MINHLLLYLFLFPLLGTVILIFVNENKLNTLKTIAAITTGIQMWIIVQLIFNFDTNIGYLQYVEQISWINLLNIDFIIGLNGINLVFLTLSTILFFTAIFINWKERYHQKSFYVLIMLLNTAVTGLFMSYDLFLFTVFYGIALFSTFLLITLFTEKSNGYTAGFFTFCALTSFCLIIIGVLLINNQAVSYSFNLYALAQNPSILSNIQTSGFYIFLIGFIIITPIVPFQSWYLGAIETAPTSLAVILLALIPKIGIFGILNILLPLFPQSTFRFAVLFGIIGSLNILYFAFTVFSHTDYRKIIGHFTGFSTALIFIGLSSIISGRLQQSAATISGLNGVVIYSFSSALIIIGLLLIPKVRDHITNLAAEPPSNRWVAVFMLLMVLASAIGLPGFLNFIGQFLCLIGAFHHWSTAVMSLLAMIGLVLVGIKFFRIISDTIHQNNQIQFSIKENEISFEFIVLPIILIFLFFLGIFPGAILQFINHSLRDIATSLTTL